MKKLTILIILFLFYCNPLIAKTEYSNVCFDPEKDPNITVNNARENIDYDIKKKNFSKLYHELWLSYWCFEKAKKNNEYADIIKYLIDNNIF